MLKIATVVTVLRCDGNSKLARVLKYDGEDARIYNDENELQWNTKHVLPPRRLHSYRAKVHFKELLRRSNAVATRETEQNNFANYTQIKRKRKRQIASLQNE